MADTRIKKRAAADAVADADTNRPAGRPPRRRANQRAIIELPENIIEEILLRLPAKTLLVFRTACKLFDSLSTHPNFIRAHTQRLRNLPATSLALFNSDGPTNSLYLVHGPTRIHLIRHLTTPHTHKLAASCDGLLCFTFAATYDVHPFYVNNDRNVAVVNPLTGHSFSFSLREHDFRGHIALLGLYLNELSNQYKLLIQNHDGDIVEYFVLTVGTNSLRSVENSTGYKMICPRSGPLWFRGKLCCFGMGMESRKIWTMVFFDTEIEQFGQLPLPDNSFDSFGYYGRLRLFEVAEMMEIEGRLCLYKVRMPSGVMEVRLWVLTDFRSGVWVRKLRVRTEDLQRQRGEFGIVAYSCLHRRFLLVKRGTTGIDSPDKVFTFYCFMDEHVRDKDPFSPYIST